VDVNPWFTSLPLLKKRVTGDARDPFEEGDPADTGLI
jgi:hypothetical protein